MKPCFLIPIYDHGSTIRDVVKSLEPYESSCIVIDDGSGEPTARALAALEREFDWVVLRRLPENRGKGAALARGLELAAELGFTHAITLDADGQHDTSDVPRFMEASREAPDALVLGEPVFDESVPTARRVGRRLSCFLVRVETLSRAIHDPLCGFRSIPVAPALAVLASARIGKRMDFDPELAVRLANTGTPVRNLTTLVRYPPDGTSHFQLVRDNLRISWFHTRMLVLLLASLPGRLLGKASDTDGKAWDRSKERGSLLGLRFLVGCYRHLGRRVAFLLVDPVVVYFFLTDPKGRRASREYLKRIAATATATGRERVGPAPGLWASFLHYRMFAVSIFDRLEIWFGRSEDFEVETEGIEYMAAKAREGQGAMLIGAHLGSFDALRLLAARDDIVVNVVMFTRHAEKINRIFRELSPEATVRVIDVEPASVNSTLEIRRCIERGEFVSILGDRIPSGGRERSRSLPFLGRPARFPEGPFRLASLLGCPTLLVLALRTGRRRYRLVAEPLAEVAGGSRQGRDRRVEESMRQYARRLEHFCVRSPYQWFNFFDFWEQGSEDGSG